MKTIGLTIVTTMLLIIQLKAQIDDTLLPAARERETFIRHNSFSMSYNSSYVLPSWVIYKVTKLHVNTYDKVKGKYIPDPGIKTRAAEKKDYDNEGYLMAQLVNYLDVKQIEGGVEETYYMSNIVPMKLAFYNNIWLKIEELMRLWTVDTDELVVICGPVLSESPFPTMGKNKVSIPKRYYKVVYDPKNQKAVGFIVKNGTASGTLKSYALSVDEIEAITGIDFFPLLDDELENKIERKWTEGTWNFILPD